MSKDQNTTNKHLLFAGGGTAGPVTPLLAVIEGVKQRHPNFTYHWVGTKNGPEKKLTAGMSIAFSSIVTVKLDRFFSLRNFLTPFLFLIACIQAIRILAKEQPDIVVAAGGFVAVPVIFMAKVMGIETLIHQLDVRPTLSNKLVAPVVDTITVTFSQSLQDFPQKKTIHVGAPIRESILHPKEYRWEFSGLKPVVLIFGGGTGAVGMNELVFDSLDRLVEEVEVIHITGKGKGKEGLDINGYHQFEFLRAKMGDAYRNANLVIARAGIGTIIELAALEKPAIIMPLPHSHQWDNANMLKDANAAMILDQTALSPQLFAETILKLVKDEQKLEAYRRSIAQFYLPNAADLIVDEIEKLLYR